MRFARLQNRGLRQTFLRLPGWKNRIAALLAAAMVCGLAAPAAAEPVPFRQAMELALARSGLVAIAAANRQKARDTYEVTRGAYLPTIVFGSGLGYSLGIPPALNGSAPSIFNVTTQQALFNLSLRDQVRAARMDWKSSDLDVEEKRTATLMNAATAYIELDHSLQKLKVLTEEAQTANRAEFITSQRIKEGLDSQLELKKAQLAVARVQLRIAEAKAAADVARQRLGRLTGLSPESIETVGDSIPAPPPAAQEQQAVAQALTYNPQIRLANERVRSAELRARGETRAVYPSIDIATQYQRLSTTINNYQQFYRNYEPNSFAAGLSFRFPVSDFAQHARAHAAQSELLRVRKEAELTRNQVEETTLRTQRGLERLRAAAAVAKLEYEVAQAGIESARAKVESGQANARDQENAQLESNDRFSLYLDSQMEVTRSILQLLQQTGELESWMLPESK